MRNCTLGAALVTILSASAAADVITVQTVGRSFTPATIQARPGDTVHFVFDACCHSVNQSANSVTCSPMPGGFASGNCGDSNTWDYVIPANASGTLFYICACHCISGMRGQINIQSCEGASVTLNPADVTACRGGDATFSVAASGTGPLSYQWRFEGEPIPGANGATHTMQGVTLLNVGRYDCVVSNDCGSQTSGHANLNICGPDQNCDGFLDFFDYDDYVTAFESGAESAEYNGDGFLDFFDYDAFVAAFESGC